MFNSKGTTLLELLVAMFVIGIVAGFALPNLQRSLALNERIAVTNRFTTSILFARNVAITRNSEAIVCPSIDGLQCGQIEQWSFGWIVALPVTDTREFTVLRSEENNSNVNVKSNRAEFVLRPPTRRSTNGTVVFCHQNPLPGRAVIVSYTGRPRSSNTRANGDALECSDET